MLGKPSLKPRSFKSYKHRPQELRDTVDLGTQILRLKAIIFSDTKEELIRQVGEDLWREAVGWLSKVETIIQQNGWRYHVAMPYQEQFHTDRYRQRSIFGGNGSGKTRAMVWEMVCFAMGFNPYKPDLFVPAPCDIVIAGQTAKTMRMYLNDYIFRFLPAKEIKKVHYLRNDMIDFIELHNGRRIILMSYDQGRERFQGFAPFAVGMDEEPPEEIYHEVLARVMRTKGYLVMAMTPLSGLSWTYHEIYLKSREDPETQAYMWDTRDNATLDAEEVARIMEKFPEEIRRARMTGQFVGMTGIIYPWLNDDDAYCTPFEIPAHWQRVRSIDESGAGVTCCLWFAVDEFSNLWLYREYYAKMKTISEHAASIRMMSAGEEYIYDLIDGACLKRQATGTALKTSYEYWTEALYGDNRRSQLVPVTEKSLQDGVMTVQEYLKAAARYRAKEWNYDHPFVRVFKGLNAFKTEARMYHWKPLGRHARGSFGATPVQKNCHAMDAFRYALHYGIRFQQERHTAPVKPWKAGWLEIPGQANPN